MTRTHRRTKLTAIPSALTLLAATSCGTVQPGQAIADGAAAADYVSAKYNRIVGELSVNMIGKNGIRTHEEADVDVDDKTSKFTNTSSAAGKPLEGVTVNEHNNDPSFTLLILYPAKSKRIYMQLGRAYEKLAKTPWVSTPSADGSSIDEMSECFWDGLLKTCDAINTFADAIINANGSRVVSASSGRSTTLKAEISLNTIIRHRLIDFPARLMPRISAKMRRDRIPATLTLDSRGKLQEMRYLGTIKDGSHSVRFNIRFSYGPGDSSAIPHVPRPRDVTSLKTQRQADRFTDKMAKIGGN